MNWAEHILIQRWRCLVTLDPALMDTARHAYYIWKPSTARHLGDWANETWNLNEMTYQNRARAGMTSGELDHYARTAVERELGL